MLCDVYLNVDVFCVVYFEFMFDVFVSIVL